MLLVSCAREGTLPAFCEEGIPAFCKEGIRIPWKDTNSNYGYTIIAQKKKRYVSLEKIRVIMIARLLSLICKERIKIRDNKEVQ